MRHYVDLPLKLARANPTNQHLLQPTSLVLRLFDNASFFIDKLAHAAPQALLKLTHAHHRILFFLFRNLDVFPRY